MPTFRFRLEAQDGSGHFRSGTTEAETRDAAKSFLEEREAQFVAFTLDDERAAELCKIYGVESVDELPSPAPASASEADKAAFRELAVRDRSHVNLHRQSKPYKLVSLVEVK